MPNRPVIGAADKAAKPEASTRPSGVAATNPALGPARRTPGRGQRVQRHEAGADQEGQRHQEDAGILSLSGCLTGGHARADIDERDAQHQPEVRRMVFPHDVEVRPGEQEAEARHRQRQQGGEGGDPAPNPTRALDGRTP